MSATARTQLVPVLSLEKGGGAMLSSFAMTQWHRSAIPHQPISDPRAYFGSASSKPGEWRRATLGPNNL